MDTRILLEVGALRLALPHIMEEDLARARELLELFSNEKDPIKRRGAKPEAAFFAV